MSELELFYDISTVMQPRYNHRRLPVHIDKLNRKIQHTLKVMFQIEAIVKKEEDHNAKCRR